jgi:hypothetical protein
LHPVSKQKFEPDLQTLYHARTESRSRGGRFSLATYSGDGVRISALDNQRKVTQRQRKNCSEAPDTGSNIMGQILRVAKGFMARNITLKGRECEVKCKVVLVRKRTCAKRVKFLRWKEMCWSKQQRGRAVAQAVSHWLPTAAARVRVRAARGVCGGQSGTGAGFLRVLLFPLPIIPPISSSS